ncbi:hypothetical protein HJC23_005022 [Cyclotella cryptica]|uniref:Uncharacterized protein n=1 Tax=Cyclotella cryptica TaxID=29204 RepID=A0ABD3QD98_9STRA
MMYILRELSMNSTKKIDDSRSSMTLGAVFEWISEEEDDSAMEDDAERERLVFSDDNDISEFSSAVEVSPTTL